MNNQKRNKRIYITVGLLIMLMVVSFIVIIINNSNSAKNGTIDSNYQLFSNSWYSINHPKDYLPESQDDSEINSRFRKETDESSPEFFTVFRYGETAKLPNSEDFGNLIKTSTSQENAKKVQLNNYQALTLTTKTSDETTTRDYYVFSEYYVWKISFVLNSNSDLQKYIDDILQTFIPNDAAIRSLSVDVSHLDWLTS